MTVIVLYLPQRLSPSHTVTLLIVIISIYVCSTALVLDNLYLNTTIASTPTPTYYNSTSS